MDGSYTPLHRGGEGPPMVCLHGFTDTWRTWELVLPALEREHDVLAPTLVGHAGGPPIEGELSDEMLADAVERAMDEAGFETAHIVGNSLGAELLLHQLRGAANCDAAAPLIQYALDHGWDIGAATIECPVRIVWGTDDKILPFPRTVARFRDDWLPTADYVELDGIGHWPQLDVPAECAELILGFSR